MNKRSELAKILRQLAYYVDNQSSDEGLASIFKQASTLMHTEPRRKKSQVKSKVPIDTEYLQRIAGQLVELPSREAGEALLKEKVANRPMLESLARLLQLPVQRDDNLERLRAKIVENSIGSRLRSNAIQGNTQPRNE